VRFRDRVPGLALAAAIAGLATLVGKAAPVVGAPVAGIAVGALLGLRITRESRLRPGIAFAGRTVLQVAVVALGAQLSLRQVAEGGLGSLPVMLGTLVVCLTLAVLIGRRLRIESDLRTLIGVGTAICGASAISAVSPAIRARAGLIPASAHGAAQAFALFLITVALSAIGLSVDVTAMRRAGPRPLLLGGALWITVGSASLLLQAARL
jgi:uncharacterized membrane protein YadS